jgi:hypothetical protein
MSTVVYTKLKELELQDKEVFEFGNWLRNFSEDTSWSYDEDEDSEDKEDIDEEETPKNKKGDIMEYPWDDFSFIVIPDSDGHLAEAENISAILGTYERFDIEDSDRTFFVVK